MNTQWTSYLFSFLEWVICALFAAIIILGGLQVFFRYILESSLVWSEEVSKILFFYIIYIGAVLAIRNSSFASVDFLSRKFPPKFKRQVDLLIWALIVCFLVTVIILGTQITLNTVDQITPALEIPQAIIYFILPLGAFLMIIPSLGIISEIINKKKDT